MNLSEFKPQKSGESDKYSARIYQFIKKYPLYTRVYYQNENLLDSFSASIFNNQPLPRARVFFLYSLDEPVGDKLANIINMTHPGVKAGFSINTAALIKEGLLEEITDWFWQQYQARGRCLYMGHEEHCQNDNQRFLKTDNGVKCEWCGMNLKMEV